jgi:hypothetical protein
MLEIRVHAEWEDSANHAHSNSESHISVTFLQIYHYVCLFNKC